MSVVSHHAMCTMPCRWRQLRRPLAHLQRAPQRSTTWQRCDVAMLPCCHAWRCCYVAMLRWCHVAMLPCCHVVELCVCRCASGHLSCAIPGSPLVPWLSPPALATGGGKARDRTFRHLSPHDRCPQAVPPNLLKWLAAVCVLDCVGAATSPAACTHEPNLACTKNYEYVPVNRCGTIPGSLEMRHDPLRCSRTRSRHGPTRNSTFILVLSFPSGAVRRRRASLARRGG